jgi:hypothetical protein
MEMGTRQDELDLAAFERRADLLFKQETELMYDEEIAKVKDLVESYENVGIASAGKYVDRAADLVLARFKRVEAIFRESYLKPFEASTKDVTKTLEDWLRNKMSRVIEDQVATARGMTKSVCWKFQPLPKDRLNARCVQVQDEGRHMQQRLTAQPR